MAESKRIRYLFVNMSVRTYKRVQVVLIFAWMAGCVLSFIYLRGQSHWILGNLWWICIIAAVGEVIESLTSLKKARNRQQE